MQSTSLSAFSKTYSHDAKYLLLGRSDVLSRHQLKSLRREIWPNSYRVILGSLTYPTRHLTVSTAAAREGVTSKSDHGALSKKALYAFRVVTGEEMLSGLSEPTAGIQVGVIGEDAGSALIQRIGRAEHSWSNGRPPDGWGFFEAGSVDEYFWIGPEINPVAALWLAPEAGRWLVAEARLLVCPLDASVAYEFGDKVVDEEDWKTAGEEDRVDVNNQLGFGTLYVFEGRSDPIEANRDLSALELIPKAIFERIPSPVSQPVSRSSDSLDSLTDTKDRAPALATIHTISRDAITQALSWGMSNSISAGEVELRRMQGLQEYIDLKQWLLTTTALLVGLGTIGAYAVGGIEVAQGYGVGGLAGSVYFYNLQRRVDSIPRQSASQAALHDGQKQEFGDVHSVQTKEWVNSGIIVNQGGRVLLVAIVAACLQSVKWSEIQIQPSQLLCGLLGFVSFKVALGLSVFRQK